MPSPPHSPILALPTARALSFLLALSIVILSGCPNGVITTPPPPPTSYDTNYRLCFPHAVGVPGQSGPPTVDGVVLNDMGWTRAYRYTFGNGSNWEGAMQAIRRDDTVYFSFEVAGDPTLDEFDRVIVVMDPDGSGTNYRMLQIKPFATGATGSGSNVPPEAILYWTGSRSAGTWTWSSATPPGSVDAKVAHATAGATASWQLELSLNGGEFDLPPIDYFGLYTNVIVADGGAFTAEEYPWPTGRVLTGPGGPFTPELGIPDPSGWGNASRSSGAECFGVYFTAGDIASSPPPAGTLSLTAPNTFHVDVYNTSVDGGGNFLAAPGVSATFRIAEFGLGSGWSQIPVSNNPTPATTIPAAAGPATPGTATLSTGAWSAPAAFEDHLHQCVLVELHSADPDVTFINRSTWRNMNFQAVSSPFSGRAVVHTRGYRLAEGMQHHEFLLTAEGYNTERQRWRWEVDGAEQLDASTYRLRVAAGVEAVLEFTIIPPDVEIPSQDVHLAPGIGAAGQFVSVQVRPGSLLTLIASGGLTLRPGDQRIVGPNGLGDRELVVDPGDFLLAAHHSPASRIGALVGSWDGFDESSFVIGSGRSLKVPSGVSVLSLAINDTEEGYQGHRGEGFAVQVVQTEARPEFGATSSLVGRDPDHDPAALPIGVNLPSWRLCGKRRTGRQLIIEDRTIDVYENAGCVGYMVHRIGQ